MIPRRLRHLPVAANLAGPFAFQANSQTRVHEYPWAFHALALEPGMRVLEIGGSNSGFQFVLDRVGCEVVNVDPGEQARGRGWPVTPAFLTVLNRRFGTRVELRNCFLDQTDLPDASFDRVVSISTIEHVPEPDIKNILTHAGRLLRPGGLLVLTVDLFLDIAPFADATQNEWGTNISMKWLIEESKLTPIAFEPRELCGYPEFDPAQVLAHRHDYLIGRSYPVMIQSVVLRKER